MDDFVDLQFVTSDVRLCFAVSGYGHLATCRVEVVCITP